MSETSDHMALAQFLHLVEGRLPMLAYCKHTPNEALDAGRKVRGVPLEVLRGAQMGVRAGVWDWELLAANACEVGGRPRGWYAGLAIELKAARYARNPEAGLSEDQKRWRRHYEAQQWRCEIFCDWGEAAAYLVRWAGGNVADFRGLLRGGNCVRAGN